MEKKIQKAFTLSEVLITLVIIGVIAAITIPALMSTLENQHYKSAYKKALSDFSRAVLKSVAFREFPERTKKFDSEITQEEWKCVKENFVKVKTCEGGNIYECWVDADRVYGFPNVSSSAFIDASGRAWVLYNHSENIYFVDTNGDRKPNIFGKDRWIFTLADENGKRIRSAGKDAATEPVCSNPSLPAKIIPYRSDYKNYDSNWCHHPPCYYASWLYK